MSRYHLRNNLFFEVENEQVVISWADRPGGAPRVLCKVPYNEWASTVAFTSKRGENGSTYRQAFEILTTEATDA